MTIPEIKQEPIIVKNNWVNGNTNAKYRPECKTIPFYIDYVSDGCVEGWDDTNHELFMHDLDYMVKNNHTYKGYKKNKKVIFPWRECTYVGWVAKTDGEISEVIDTESNIMFRVPTNLLIDLKEYKAQPEVQFYDNGSWNADGKKLFKIDDGKILKGKVINFYKENGEMVYIILSDERGSFYKIKKEDFIKSSTYHKLNPYYRYGEEMDKVKVYD